MSTLSLCFHEISREFIGSPGSSTFVHLAAALEQGDPRRSIATKSHQGGTGRNLKSTFPILTFGFLRIKHPAFFDLFPEIRLEEFPNADILTQTLPPSRLEHKIPGRGHCIRHF